MERALENGSMTAAFSVDPRLEFEVPPLKGYNVPPDRLLKGHESGATPHDLTKRNRAGDPAAIKPQNARNMKPTSGAISSSNPSTVSNSFAVLRYEKASRAPPFNSIHCSRKALDKAVNTAKSTFAVIGTGNGGRGVGIGRSLRLADIFGRRRPRPDRRSGWPAALATPVSRVRPE